MTGNRRLRLGMVGGGEGAFIGAVHRMAARLDDRWELVAGAFSTDAQKSRAFGQSLGLESARAYPDWQTMVVEETARDDRIDAVAIVTPNHAHFAPAKAFLEAGIAVICDKPLTTNLQDALTLEATVRETGVPFVLTHNYSGYPMVRHARDLVAQGALGAIRVVQVEYAQDWLAEDLPDQKQAAWRGDPSRAGPGGALGDIATHAFHIAGFVVGAYADEVSAQASNFVPGRRLDDDVQVQMRWASGARGQLWASQVAIGAANALSLRVYGESAALEWAQEDPDMLKFTRLGEAPQLLRRGGPGLGSMAEAATRIPAGHPEGYLEGFAQIYADAATVISNTGKSTADGHGLVPDVHDGVTGVRFILAALASAADGSRWCPLSEVS